MRICIDSCVFVHGLRESDRASVRLLDMLNENVMLVIPRLIAQEVTRNLMTREQVQRFYRLFQSRDFTSIVDEPVPDELVAKYVNLRLPAKADAYIGAFAEWMQVRCLISDNRHFLQELRTDAFEVLDAAAFIARWESGAL